MGHRTLKRVPLDFDWPVGTVWHGYQNPYHPMNCPYCDGSGFNPQTREISESFYAFSAPEKRWCSDITQDEVQALWDARRLHDFFREDKDRIPIADEVNRWNETRMGHDAINRFILVETRAKRLGVYGHCSKCDQGDLFRNENHKAQYEEWTNFDPPTGDGYQLWETTTEGSPKSPVFETPEQLADWCAENTTIFGAQKARRDEWLAMFREEDGCEYGSMLIGTANYVGAVANMAKPAP